MPLRSQSTVAVFGAGIAGLTVAHELGRLGYRISVYESNAEAGGFFRSGHEPESNMPTEYSWHGMGPWYHNAFDLLRQIPFDEKGTVYERALSRPIDFGIFPNEAPAHFYDAGVWSIPAMFRWSKIEFVRWMWLMLKAWAAHDRSENEYARLNAAMQWRPLLRATGYRTWRACFGPWIGSDWTRVSLHTTGRFFCKQLTTRPPHYHPGDADGPAWCHGAGDGWLLLRGPSTEFWFNRWVGHLRSLGVGLFFSSPLQELQFDGRRISGARLASGERVTADHYVLAINPFAAADVVDRSPGLAGLEQLRNFRPLVQDGPHTQVSFRLAFAEAIRFPRARAAIVVADSPFNLTLFPEEQAWRPEVPLGDGVKSLWTGTSCIGSAPGILHGRPVTSCTKEEFIEEVLAQILSCGALDAMVREANGGRGLGDFPVRRVEVWHEWKFSRTGIKPLQPKWVTSTTTQGYQPTQNTPVPNLFLAGAHTRTDADVWSIEGAVESGRRAARLIDPRVHVLPQHHPAVLRFLGRVDDICYRCGAPHVLDLGLTLLLTAALLVLGWDILRE
jgi:hypothetical protein